MSDPLDVFVCSTASLWHKQWAEGWSDWEFLSELGWKNFGPTVVSRESGALDVFVISTGLWHRRLIEFWSAWEDLGHL